MRLRKDAVLQKRVGWLLLEFHPPGRRRVSVTCSAGTSFSEILLDEAAAIKLATSAPEQLITLARGPGGYNEEEVDEALYGDDEGGLCGRDALHLDVALPAAALAPVQETMEDDVEISVI